MQQNALFQPMSERRNLNAFSVMVILALFMQLALESFQVALFPVAYAFLVYALVELPQKEPPKYDRDPVVKNEGPQHNNEHARSNHGTIYDLEKSVMPHSPGIHTRKKSEHEPIEHVLQKPSNVGDSDQEKSPGNACDRDPHNEKGRE